MGKINLFCCPYLRAIKQTKIFELLSCCPVPPSAFQEQKAASEHPVSCEEVEGTGEKTNPPLCLPEMITDHKQYSKTQYKC